MVALSHRLRKSGAMPTLQNRVTAKFELTNSCFLCYSIIQYIEQG